MSESKKLRISEIRNNVFIIERHDEGDPGKWITLNLKGEERQDVYTNPGVIVRIDPCEYKDLESAEKAMNDFLTFPRVIKTSDHELKVDPGFNGKNFYQSCKSKHNVGQEASPKVVLKAVSTISDMHRLEEIFSSIIEFEEELNVIAEKINWLPFKITIGRINENVDNPI